MDLLETTAAESEDLAVAEPQDAAFATIGEIYDDGVTLIFDGQEAATEKHYKCNSFAVFQSGDRVRIIKDSGTYVVEYPVGAPKRTFHADTATTAASATKADSATKANTADNASNAKEADSAACLIDGASDSKLVYLKIVSGVLYFSENGTSWIELGTVGGSETIPAVAKALYNSYSSSSNYYIYFKTDRYGSFFWSVGGSTFNTLIDRYSRMPYASNYVTNKYYDSNNSYDIEFYSNGAGKLKFKRKGDSSWTNIIA